MSGARFLLDTNVVIGYLADREPAKKLIAGDGVTLESSAVSQITRMELLGFPDLTNNEATSLESFFATVRVILLDEKIETVAIELRRTRRHKLPDAIIAATAIVYGLKLLTLDERLATAIQSP